MGSFNLLCTRIATMNPGPSKAMVVPKVWSFLHAAAGPADTTAARS